jgi:hypothetical protein
MASWLSKMADLNDAVICFYLPYNWGLAACYNTQLWRETTIELSYFSLSLLSDRGSN